MCSSNDAMQRSRHDFTPDQNATTLRRHLADKITVSDLSDEYQLSSSLFHLWQKQALEHLTAALQDGHAARSTSQAASADRARIAALEAVVAKKDRLSADVSDEYFHMNVGYDDWPLSAARSA